MAEGVKEDQGNKKPENIVWLILHTIGGLMAVVFGSGIAVGNILGSNGVAGADWV